MDLEVASRASGGVCGVGAMRRRPWLVSRPRRRAALDDAAERLVELRIVHRQDRAPAQLPDEAAEPDRAERQRQHDVEPADGRCRAGGTRARSARTDRPGATSSTPTATFDEQLRLRASPAARAARRTARRSARRSARGRRARQPVCRRCRYQRDLRRQVARPDDQVLREREVGPQHHERAASGCRDRGSARRRRCDRAARGG